MSLDWAALEAAVAAHGRVVRVVVAEAKGSAPREAGAAMTVWAEGFDGTIGGGALEFEALAEARRRLVSGASGVRAMPLGPALGQCCGGAVTLVFEVWDEARVAALRPARGAGLLTRPLGGIVAPADPPLAVRGARRSARAGRPEAVFVPGDPPWLAEPLAPEAVPLWLWGAGHVGRAVVRVFEGLPFAITWVDDARERFPEAVPAHARMLVAARPAEAVALAPAGAAHLVMTYSHALDLEIAHGLLARGDFARLGVIGSATKAARFRARLAALGHGPEAIARMECPIGLRGPDGLLGGKRPAEIAVSVAADHLAWRAARERTREAAG